MYIEIIPSEQTWKTTRGEDTKQVPEFKMRITKEELGKLVAKGFVEKDNLHIKVVE
jgi:hypothetical protein